MPGHAQPQRCEDLWVAGAVVTESREDNSGPPIAGTLRGGTQLLTTPSAMSL